MKKLLIAISFLGMMAFFAPKVANAEAPCTTQIITCPDGTQHIAIVCSGQDWEDWMEILCDVCYD